MNPRTLLLETFLKWSSWGPCIYNNEGNSKTCKEIGIKQRFRECIRWVWLKVKRCLYNISVVLAKKVSTKNVDVNIQFIIPGRNGQSVLARQIEDVGPREVLIRISVEEFAT